MSLTSERIRDARRKARLTQKEVADALGIKKQSVSGWETGKAEPSPDSLDQLTELLGVTRSWLLGRGEHLRPASRTARSVDLPDLAAVVSVPYFGRVGAGDPRDPPVVVGEIDVSPSLYAADFGEPPRIEGNEFVAYEQFGYFRIDGDSASPVFFDGERLPVQLLPNHGHRFVNDLLYVFLWDGMHQLKRLRLHPRGRVEAMSLNPAIPSFFFNPSDDPEEFSIVALARVGIKQQIYTSLVGRFLRDDPN